MDKYKCRECKGFLCSKTENTKNKNSVLAQKIFELIQRSIKSRIVIVEKIIESIWISVCLQNDKCMRLQYKIWHHSERNFDILSFGPNCDVWRKVGNKLNIFSDEECDNRWVNILRAIIPNEIDSHWQAEINKNDIIIRLCKTQNRQSL